jgi:hypothetical protein
MPALNIDFTDEELEALRRRAAVEGVSMRRLAHDLLVNDTARASYDAEVTEAAAYVIKLSSDLLNRLADR